VADNAGYGAELTVTVSVAPGENLLLVAGAPGHAGDPNGGFARGGFPDGGGATGGGGGPGRLREAFSLGRDFSLRCSLWRTLERQADRDRPSLAPWSVAGRPGTPCFWPTQRAGWPHAAL
jgi:hypothetical protein